MGRVAVIQCPAMNAEDMLTEARSRITRVTPAALLADLDTDVIVVDLRCAEERRRTGVIPDSIPIGRSVLEWRLDPTSQWRDDRVARPDARMILVCEDGYSSSLAADSVRRLGFADIGDLDGGMTAWIAAGLPLEPATD